MSIRLLTVEEARARMLAPFAPGPPETVPLAQAVGRVLAADVTARRDQPPYDASAMDGWAVRQADLSAGEALTVQGESAAGVPFGEPLAPRSAVRVFTGAAVPAGADRVVIQEEGERDGGSVRLSPVGEARHLRPRGRRFSRRARCCCGRGRGSIPGASPSPPAAGRGELQVAPRPRVALLSTGEEIVEAGAEAGDHQIFESNTPALAARAAAWGAQVAKLRPARDDESAIAAAVEGADAELVVTIGGASVGDHDLVKPALRRLGLELMVESVAVRPGKPTWFGGLGDGRRRPGPAGQPGFGAGVRGTVPAPAAAHLAGRRPGLPSARGALGRPPAAYGSARTLDARETARGRRTA